MRWGVAGGIAATAVCLLALALGQGQQAHPQPPSPDTNAPAAGSTAAAAPAAKSSLSRSAPVRLDIPAIDVSTPLTRLGLAEDRTLEVPTNPAHAGWYQHSPSPGETGPAVIAGHVDSPTGPAVFFRLGSLRPGDRLRVTRTDGRVAVFRVDRVASYAKDAFPTRAVYGYLPHAGLRLITCGGSYDSDRGGYQANVVVFASLARVD